MSETETPRFLRRRPSEATLIPLPTDDATPPVTKMNFDIEKPSLIMQESDRSKRDPDAQRPRSLSPNFRAASPHLGRSIVVWKMRTAYLPHHNGSSSSECRRHEHERMSAIRHTLINEERIKNE